MGKEYELPSDLVVLISGVPGVGKTTISYELLKKHNEFRLVEETDIIREVLRGYNDHLSSVYQTPIDGIYSHDIFLSYAMAKQQCKIMKNSIINIVKRQQRKGIASIINGVHIIPEELYFDLSFPNIIYINLYIDSEASLWNRLKKRNPQKYTYDCIPYLYQTNKDLNSSLLHLPKELCTIYSINVSALTPEETICIIDNIFCTQFGDN
ncbi:AAA family ATPase [Lachnospiraceae bacterium 47-T17]